jgi:quercetin dioxygenase-like cupin family protein
MRSIVVDGVEHDLGILKHWRKNAQLARFLPKDLKFSLAWVRLAKGQVLDVHVHPVDTMVVCCQGRVQSKGDLEAELSEGDIILIPTGYRHGFVGAGSDGFWGLSIQYESVALYEDLDSPLVTFVESRRIEEGDLDAVTLLLQRNEHYYKEFARNKVFTLLRDGYFAAEAPRARLLDYLQVWSDVFQKMLMCRVALTDNPRYAALANAHLQDEFGHNKLLAEGRRAQRSWDPLVESTANWFLTQMMTLDNAEKTVLMHLVVETGAHVFYQEFAPRMTASEDGRRHFELHSDAKHDLEHVKMGVDMLRSVPLKDRTPLLEVQQRGWQTMNALFTRIAALVTS